MLGRRSFGLCYAGVAESGTVYSGFTLDFCHELRATLFLELYGVLRPPLGDAR